MPLYAKLPEDIREVDVIVAGGTLIQKDETCGTAGCVTASRLAEADPDLSILVIEQGLNNYNVSQVIYPALFPSNLLLDSKTALFWKGNKSPQLADREPIVPSGGILGGGSSINWMVYTRPQRSDFDSWNMPGWSANELWPYLKKFETYHGRGEREHHGHDGPINISSGTFRAHRAENDFIKAAATMGYTELKDLQNLDANNATERWLRYVGPDGRRQDAAHRFLHPKLNSGGYPNLHVLVEHQVVRVLFDRNKRACGVEYQPNPKFMSMLADSSKRTVRASKMVVLSAGANGSPLILERSGVGDPEILKRARVPLVEALPNVGKEYQDHHLTLYAYRTSLSHRETINGFHDGRFDIQDAIRKNDELLGWNSMDASGKFRPTEQEVAALGPAFKRAWDRDFKDAADRPLMIIAMYLAYFGDHADLPDSAEYISSAAWTAYPYSRGHIHITGRETSSSVDFDVGYLNDAGDVDIKKHVWAYKVQREMFRRMSIYRGELASSHPKFAPNSRAAVVERANGPVGADEPLIQYSAADDRAIEQNIRETVSTTWHSLGTCKMAPREKGGVVDQNLSVYGVRGLKIADLSVPPENVGANTNNTALTIGEKAADLFVKELGLRARM
ncbi:Alcohol oxidase [Lecanosticta acicola]|uniref:Alcohol oxidase n=1 Tax=Lecanosticta acicola TaxID=111012 RepID=A0AAI9EF52_9PEZI|nr:Alcohol oxidase [Lecanosticta acicola]